ncbi:MAG TPA: response regulator [Acidimicrobiales bacterium]|nr:response regulator [Acidimicrobiales bacterium]
MNNVLIVDDEADIRLLLSTMLSAAGYQVIEAAEGEAALAAIERGGVDVVLLDLMMPVMDGWAVLWTLHDAPVHPPVIVMSARPEYKDQKPPLGAVEYLQKPFPLEEAVDTVRKILAQVS